MDVGKDPSEVGLCSVDVGKDPSEIGLCSVDVGKDPSEATINNKQLLSNNHFCLKADSLAKCANLLNYLTTPLSNSKVTLLIFTRYSTASLIPHF